MDNPSEDTVQLHGDEEIVEVIDLNDTQQSPGECVNVNVRCGGSELNKAWTICDEQNL